MMTVKEYEERIRRIHIALKALVWEGKLHCTQIAAQKSLLYMLDLLEGTFLELTLVSRKKPTYKRPTPEEECSHLSECYGLDLTPLKEGITPDADSCIG